jgi:hypothetical protein
VIPELEETGSEGISRFLLLINVSVNLGMGYLVHLKKI